MKLVLLFAASFIASASLAAREPTMRWELTKSLSYDDYRDGKLLAFHGHSGEAFLRPDINDFRLQRLSPEMTWIPMIFGRDFELSWPADTEMTDVRLYLKCPGAVDRSWRQEEGLQLYAETWIEANASYRLTWSRRLPRQPAKLHHIEFQLKGEFQGDAEVAKDRPAFPQQAYLCEVLYKDKGVQFLARTVRPQLFLGADRYEIPAIGFTADGQPVDPPNPGYQRIKRILEMSTAVGHAKQKPPPAVKTGYIGFSLEDERVSVRVSDIGTSAALPQEPGKPAFVMFSDYLYRIELLTENIEILRVDRDFWRERTRQIREEWEKESRR